MKGVLFDMDGVLAAVGNSYNLSIELTARYFGVSDITQEDIANEKKQGNSNNDWILSQRIIKQKINKDIPIETVTEVFEEIYQGTDSRPGLCETETLIPAVGVLKEIHKRCNGNIAIVTGRPRKDCMKFLQTHKIADLFKVAVCMGDTQPKPSPDPVIKACELLKIPPCDCIMIGDTPDDVKAAKLAGAIPYGVLTPEEHASNILGISKVEDGMAPSLISAGASMVIKPGLGELLDIVHPCIAATSSLRVGLVERKTKETSISVKVNIDGVGKSSISTGIGFLDHMLSQLSKHGRFDIDLQCVGDLHIDDHHTAEDCAIVLGEAFDRALGKREGINRFGLACCPLDESLSRVVVDISSRPHSVVDIQFTR